MKKQVFALLTAILISIIGLLAVFWGFSSDTPGLSTAALAAPLQTSPTVTQVDPTSAPSDLDTPIVITGTGFTAELSGTQVITPPAVTLGEITLANVTWVSSATLETSVPWGMDPGFYTLTVVNPGGEAASLAEAFTVTQGINTWSSGGPYGGWIYALALGDSQGETIFATIGNVGLFRSRDGGASWELIFIEIGFLNKPEIDPTNLDRLYVANQINENPGLYRSEDGGDTWTAMPQPIPGVNPRVFLAFVNPHDSTLFGALRADMDSPSCVFGCGLFRFNETSQAWTRLEESGLLDENTGVTAVAFDPQDPDTMYAGLVGGKVLKSIDGGDTWSFHSQTPFSYIKGLAVNPVGGDLWVYSTGGILPGGLYRYDGAQWISMYSSTGAFTYVSNIIFDPDASNEQTQHIWIAAIFDGVLESDDGGQTWINVNPNRSEDIALNPKNPAKIYSGSNEGVSKTSDGGVTWQAINEELTGIVPKNMGVSPHDPAVVFGVADSIGIFGSRNGGETWQRRTVSTGGPIVVDPVDPLHVVNADYNMLRIADDGWNFNREIPITLPTGIATEDYSAIPNAMIARPGLWIMGIGFLDRTLSNWNYEGGGGIYLSEDGENWTRVGPLLECPPTGLGFDPVDENILYAATSGMWGGVDCGENEVLRSTDGGQTWQESMAGLPESIGDRGHIAVEPTPPYRIFLNGSFVSSDQGITWSEVNAPCQSIINQMLYLPGSPSILYAATGVGLFRSMDGSQTWQRAQGSMGQLEIWSLAGTNVGDRQILYVATIGGVADTSSVQSLTGDAESLVNAGVYRYTMLPLQRIFLPLVLRH